MDYKSINWKNVENNLGRCIKVVVDNQEEAPVLQTRGLYRSTFVELPINSQGKKIEIGLAMTRSFDWETQYR